MAESRIPPLPVGPRNVTGVGPSKAWNDHAHQGVQRVVAGSNVTLTGTPDAPIVSLTGGGGSGAASVHRATWQMVAGATAPLATAAFAFPCATLDNPASDLDVSNGTFTAAVNGIYVATATAISHATINPGEEGFLEQEFVGTIGGLSSPWFAGLLHDKQSSAWIRSDTANMETSFDISAVFPMAATDVVNFAFYTGPGIPQGLDSVTVYASVYLLGTT